MRRRRDGREEEKGEGETYSIPSTFLLHEIFPKDTSGEFLRNDDTATTQQRGQESSEKSMDVEEGHDEVGSIGWCEGVGVDDVGHCGVQVEVRERDS